MTVGDLKREERQRRGLHPSPFLAVVKAAGIPAPRLVAARPLQPDQKIPHEVIPDVVLVSLEAVQSERREEVIPQRAELTAAFKASKSANKPWQVYGSSVVVPDQLTAGNMYNLMDVFPADAATIKSVMDAVYPSAGGAYFRLMYALGVMGIGWNPDSWQVPQ